MPTPDIRPIPTAFEASKDEIQSTLSALAVQEPGHHFAELEAWKGGDPTRDMGLLGFVKINDKWSCAGEFAHTPESGWLGRVGVRFSW